jgi:hypothetical protein
MIGFKNIKQNETTKSKK